MLIAEAIQEIADRGFEYLSETRRTAYMRRAIQYILQADLWPWRVQSVLSISFAPGSPFSGGVVLIPDDLGPIDSVIVSVSSSEHRALRYASIQEMYAYRGDMNAGTPRFYTPTQENDPGSSSVIIWPNPAGETYTTVVSLFHTGSQVDTDTLLSGIPEFLHYTVIDRAVSMCYRDADNHEAAESLMVDVERQLNQARLSGVESLEPSVGVEIREGW